MRQVCRNPDKLMVGPDPAFAMQPATPEAARKVLEACELHRQAKQDDRPVVAVTALETGRVYAGFRPDLHGVEKQQAHARYLAAILDKLIEKHRAFILFLPHSVEQNGNDVVAARHVIEQMKTSSDDAAVLEHDCSARLLKGIVRECDFLVGERTHSLIGSVSVGTPFAALTNRQDTRTHGIIGDMCRCEEQIVDMDAVSEAEAASKILDLFETRAAIRKSLEPIRAEISRQIEDMARIIKGDLGVQSEP
jgi:polysaccharide pyruvyl transferase WcaK-like protein